MKTKHKQQWTREADAGQARPRIVELTPAAAPASTDAAEPAMASVDVYRRLCRIEQLLSVSLLLAARITDLSHLTVPEAARVLGVSVKSVRRRIASGGLTLEAIPESKRVGIPIEQLYDGWWLPLHVARQLVHGERQELAVLKRKSR